MSSVEGAALGAASGAAAGSMFGPMGTIIGGGLGLAGSFLNTSSNQSINAANIAEQQWAASGGYLPGLVRNAERAGLSPLAVLGQHGPNMAVQVGTQPGAGLSALGRDIAGVGFQYEREELAREIGQSQLERARAEVSNQKIQGELAKIELARVAADPRLRPAGWQYPPVSEDVREDLSGAGRAVESGVSGWWDTMKKGLPQGLWTPSIEKLF